MNSVLKALIVSGDLFRKMRFGKDVPLLFERLYVDPRSIQSGVRLRKRYSSYSERFSLLADGDWRKLSFDWTDTAMFANTRRVVCEGLSWAESGEEERLMTAIERKKGVHEGCRSLEDVQRRLAVLDSIILDARLTRNLRSQSELRSNSFREHGGIEVAIGRDGEVLFASDGFHRLAIAYCLGLPQVPVALTKVHYDYLCAQTSIKKLKAMRKRTA